jgi:hypothetical protein
MTKQEARQLPKRFMLRIITPPLGTALRDTVAAVLIAQGGIRLIDGRLFKTTPLAYGTDVVYGSLLLGIGLLLIITRSRRGCWYGALAAALAAAFYVWLAMAVWTVSATSGAAALIYAVAMYTEARAWSGGVCGSA